MSKKEKDVELIPNTNVASGWKVKHDGKEGDKPGQGQGSYPVVEFAANSGPHLVVFTLPKDGAASFNSTDPMWIQPGSSSPTQQGMDSQIADWAILEGGKTLVLLDLNSKAGDLYYRVKADNYGPVLDPIIKNGGTSVTPPPPGGTTMTYSGTDYLMAGAALLLAFVAGFFVRKFFFPPKPVGPGGM